MLIFDQLSYCQPSWKADITENRKNSYHGSTIDKGQFADMSCQLHSVSYSQKSRMVHN